MKNILILVIGGAVTFMPLCQATADNVNYNATIEANSNSEVNAGTPAGVTTSMNGTTTTNTGLPISSTSVSKESRNVSGAGD